jgi:hypothetical protein
MSTLKIGSRYPASPMLIVPSAAGFPLVFKSARTCGRYRLSTMLGMAMTVQRFGWPRSRSLLRLPPGATITSVRDVRRPFTSAASWPANIHNTPGAILKFISIGRAWPYMVNKNNWLLMAGGT